MANLAKTSSMMATGTTSSLRPRRDPRSSARGWPDLLIAETALHHRAGVLHHDRDYRRIAKVRPDFQVRTSAGVRRPKRQTPRPVHFEPNALTDNLALPTHLGAVDDPNTVYSFHDHCTTTAILGDIAFGCGLCATILQARAPSPSR